jgi:hypothetical protein
MLVHVPGAAASAHDWHVPVQAVAQHTPCAQNPDAHSVPPAHVRPSAFFEHVPPLHTLGAAQSVSAMHVVLHAFMVVSQTYGLHDDVVAAAHIPVPLQSCGGVNTAPAGHLAAAHWVPLT